MNMVPRLRPTVNNPRRNSRVETTVENCHCLQTDAAWGADTGLAGLGWTVQKNSERSEFGAHCYYVASPLVAEALAMREAVQKCRELGIQRLRCETDSGLLVKAITSRKPSPELYGIISDIVALISEFELIQFRWIPREKNKAADALAKKALRLETIVLNSILRGV